MVDTLVSGASASRRVGSTPIIRTVKIRKNLMILPYFRLGSDDSSLFSFIFTETICISHENRFSRCGYDGQCILRAV